MLEKGSVLGVELGLFNEPFQFLAYAAMREDSGSAIVLPSVAARDVLGEILRDGAQRMLAEDVRAEVAEWIDARRDVVDERGRRQVVRNGRLPKRSIRNGLGEIEVKQPRVQDQRSSDQRERFASKILPPYLRKLKSIDGLSRKRTVREGTALGREGAWIPFPDGLKTQAA